MLYFSLIGHLKAFYLYSQSKKILRKSVVIALLRPLGFFCMFSNSLRRSHQSTAVIIETAANDLSSLSLYSRVNRIRRKWRVDDVRVRVIRFCCATPLPIQMASELNSSFHLEYRRNPTTSLNQLYANLIELAAVQVELLF